MRPGLRQRACAGRVVALAGLEHRAPKDLRDTFASWLLSLGVQLGYVSRQLGHADVAVTARHYARWVGGDEYRLPLALEPGEVPADLIARAADRPESDPTRMGDAPASFEKGEQWKVVDGGPGQLAGQHGRA